MTWLQNKLAPKLAVMTLIGSAVFTTSCVTLSGNSAESGDLLTERSVIRALYNEPNLTGDPILVSCVNGIITLSGSVDNAVEAELAERVANGIEGVTTVHNNLSF